MKKLKKRFVALIMALTMASSFSTVAFAAESEENSNMTVAEEQAKLYAIESTTDEDPLVNLTGSHYGDKRTTATYTIQIPNDRRYLYFGLMGSGSARVTIYKDGVQLSRLIVSKGAPYQLQLEPIPVSGSLKDNYWEPGQYTAKIEILFDGRYQYAIFASNTKG